MFVEAYERGGRNANQNENVQVLSAIVDKIAWNLQFYPSVPTLITPSLKLFWVYLKILQISSVLDSLLLGHYNCVYEF